MLVNEQHCVHSGFLPNEQHSLKNLNLRNDICGLQENEVSKDIARLQKRRAMTASSGRLAEIQPIHPLPQLGVSPLTHIYSSSPSFLYEQVQKQFFLWV